MFRQKTDCNTCQNTECLIKKNIGHEKMQDFLDKRNKIICKKNQQFILEGTLVNGLFFIQKGKAKVFKTGIYGKEQILRLVNNGEIIGHRGFGTSSKYPISAVALEDSLLCNFSSETLTQMFKQIPELTYDLMLFYAEELNRSETKVKTFAQMTVREKVIDTILYINRKFGINYKGLLNVQLSRKEIAEFAGTTVEQVIRVISSLKKEKLIFSIGKNIGISDLNNLKSEISEHNYFIDS